MVTQRIANPFIPVRFWAWPPKKLRSNVVYVTHDQVEAMTLADKIVIMNKGKIEQFGSPEDISLENNSEVAVKVTIDLIENLGSEKIIYTHVNDTEIRIKTTKSIKDKDITIYFPKNKLYLFDNDKNRIRT